MKNQYLYRLLPTRTEMVDGDATPEEEAAVSRHFNYLKSLMAQGQLILAGRTQVPGDKTFGIVIFNADDDERAHAIMQNDPAVIAGVMSAELFPYRIALIAEANVS
jgi:uncharacterized protein